jgi:broad specificity phosphatase PhoE
LIAFVRHGQTPPNRDGLMLGRDDPGLTDEGRLQSQQLARALRPENPTAIISSPLLRARDTAAAIAAACGLDVEVDERLVEIDWGEWEGRPVGSVGGKQGDMPSGGEALASLDARVGSFCQDVLERPGLVVAVSHVSPIKASVAWALGVDGEIAWRMYLALASITRVSTGRRGPLLVSFNETAHLAAS